MELLKETKYLQFVVVERKPKTLVIAVVNRTHDEEIGVIKWFSRWRQYCFFPHHNTIWNKTCLEDVNEVITSLTPTRPKPQPKTIAVIAYDIKDFQNWRKSKRHRGKKIGDNGTMRKYVYGNNTYICISTDTHCCGYAFDKIIETDKAFLNKNYNNIRLVTQHGLKQRS